MDVYINTHTTVVQKHINISCTGVLFAPSKLTNWFDKDLKSPADKLTKVCLELIFCR